MAPVMSFGVGGGDGPIKGPEFTAQYESICSYCGNDIEKGEGARSDGEGGWEHAEHKDEDDG